MGGCRPVLTVACGVLRTCLSLRVSGRGNAASCVAPTGVDLEQARKEEEQQMLQDSRQWLNSGKIEDTRQARSGATALHVAAAKGYSEVLRCVSHSHHAREAGTSETGLGRGGMRFPRWRVSLCCLPDLQSSLHLLVFTMDTQPHRPQLLAACETRAWPRGGLMGLSQLRVQRHTPAAAPLSHVRRDRFEVVWSAGHSFSGLIGL